MKFLKLCLFLLVMFAAASAFAQDGAEIKVGDINLPNLRWGNQQANFEVTNTTEYLKFVTVVNTISFSESYLKPSRVTKTNFVVGPLESKIITPKIYVPGNYGTATIKVELYDVIDTNDLLLPRQKFFEQPLTIQYHIPDEMLPYITTPITMPPMVGNHENWDNEMSRAMLLMFRQNKSLEEMAAIAQADVPMVRDIADKLTAATALKKLGPDEYEPTFAIIADKEVEHYRALSDRASDSLAAMIRSNLPVYRHMLDSLISVGRISADTNDFLNVGAVLKREYPSVFGLFLWDMLGKMFVTGDRSFSVFEGTDYCNLYTPFFMYAVQGGQDVNGRHFYSRTNRNSGVMINVADFIPTVVCEEHFKERAIERQEAYSTFVDSQRPEVFVFRSSTVDPVLRTLLTGHEEYINKLKGEFNSIVAKESFQNFAFGPKYWFWNWTVTKTVDKLLKDGTLTRRGNGHFQLQEM